MWGALSLWFWFSFPWWIAMLSSFSCASSLCVCLLCRNICCFSAHFSIGLFFPINICMSSLYILGINPFLGILFANTFSHQSFVFFFAGFLCCAKAYLMSSYLFTFAFIALAWGDRSKKVFAKPKSKSVLHMFSSRSFMVSCFTFRYLIRFAFIFVYGIGKQYRFILLHVAV